MEKDRHKLIVQGSSAPSARLEKVASSILSPIPFRATLSLDPLLAYWREQAVGDDALGALLPRIESYVENHAELEGPISDPDVLVEHRPFLKILSQPLFPSAYDEDAAAALILPFEYYVIHSTAAFRRLFTQDAHAISGRVNLDLRTFAFGKIVSAYLHILRSVYQIEVPFEYPTTFTTQHAETGLDTHYNVVTDLRFVKVRFRGDPPPLSDAKARHLLSHLSDLSAWMETIPPSEFEFYGVSVIRAFDVTKERMIGMLHRDLVGERSLVDRSVLPDIEDHVRTLLQLPHLELGLAVLDGNDVYVLNEPEHPLLDTFFTQSRRFDVGVLENSLFERCLNEHAVEVTEDLSDLRQRAEIEDEMHRWGVRSLLAAPLFSGDEPVGILYLWSREPCSLYMLDVMTLVELLPIFASAVTRVREDMRTRVQRVIMGQYTAIHPSVEWRFRQAALKSIQKQEEGEPFEVEPIVFEELYPLFSATDIRASSEHRNEAIRLDLLDHLERADKLLSQARDQKPRAILQHLHARIRRYRTALRDGLASNDEAAVRDFVHRDLEPIVSSLRGLGDGLEKSVADFERSAEPIRGTLYRRSQAFEESVRKINEVASDFLDSEQAVIQPFFPHYFEKHQTDGVDFTMYVGASLLEDEDYSPAFVHVLRLWQLMVMCGVALRTRLLRPELEVPLETTHLILVQNAPINIRYRFDETRFDVDGPHHIRFEIMKQRVEKATVNGSKERLTQPDKIAIVYSQEREAQEYTEYLHYLRDRGFVAPDIESLQVDDLQGVKGLRALRVRVGAESPQELSIVKPDTLRMDVERMNLPQ